MRYVDARMFTYPSVFGLRVHEHLWVYIYPCPTYIHSYINYLKYKHQVG